METHPIGSRERPGVCHNLIEAINAAKKFERKIWVRMRGETGLYEVWPGGRNVYWSRELLAKREDRLSRMSAKG